MYSEAAVLIAHTRSGGIFLNHCLSSHPQLFWPRGEPLLRGMEWKRAFPHASDVEILSCIMRAAHYKVGGCKVTYEQMNPKIWKYLEIRKAKIIHLVRENLLRCCVSQIITGMVSAQHLKGHRAHTFKKLPPPEVTISVGALMSKMRAQKQAIGEMHQKLNLARKVWDASVLNLTYSMMVSGEGREVSTLPVHMNTTICEHLGVREYMMTSQLRRVHPYALIEFIRNWDEVRHAVAQSEFAWCLEEEEFWTR